VKFIFKTILIATLCYFAGMQFPWYSVVIIAFGVSLVIRTTGISSFLSGLVAVGLLWIGQAWIIDMDSNSLLTDKIAGIFGLGASFWMIILTGLVGGLSAGFGALTGYTLRNLIQPKTIRKASGRYYS
jgi:hypothetical protein